jgi:hypothetical protein
MSIAARVQAAATFVPNLYRDLFIQVEIPIFLQSPQHYANVSYDEHLEGEYQVCRSNGNVFSWKGEDRLVHWKQVWRK